MKLEQAITNAGMAPPRELTPGRWLRFPGAGKNPSNRAGWCRVITEQLAIFGDWSRGFSEVWRAEGYIEDERTRCALIQARARERIFAAHQQERQQRVAREAQQIIESAKWLTHPYLERKGFAHLLGLVQDGKLLVPMRDNIDYRQVVSVQEISSDGAKRFLVGGRARGAIYRIGSQRPKYVVLCEGYATGLSLDAALKLLPGPHVVIVCFSAQNLKTVAASFRGAIIMADNDANDVGAQAADSTGLRWTMPYEVGTDFNDLMVNVGLHAVVERLQQIIMG